MKRTSTKIYPTTTTTTTATSGLGSATLDSSQHGMAHLVQAMKATMISLLNAKNPAEALLFVDFSRSLNTVWGSLSKAAEETLLEYAAKTYTTTSNAEEKTSAAAVGFDHDQFKDDLHAKVSIRTTVATTCPPRVESLVQWVPPMADLPMKALKKKMAKQSIMMAQPNANREQMKQAFDGLVTEQMTHYHHRMQHASANETEVIKNCVELVADLNPQFARVYSATGLMVKNEKGYAAFCTLEQELFTKRNAEPKPTQPVQTVYALQELSIASKPIMDPLMLAVRDRVDGLCVTNKKLALAVGGVAWSPAPLKRTIRIVEKICLEPSSSQALASHNPDALAAGGMLDTVRVSWLLLLLLVVVGVVVGVVLIFFLPLPFDTNRRECSRVPRCDTPFKC